MSPAGLLPRMTRARFNWLLALNKAGHDGLPYLPGKVGEECNELGWTEWQFRDRRLGKIISRREAKARYGSEWRVCVELTGRELITDVGCVELRRFWMLMRLRREPIRLGENVRIFFAPGIGMSASI